VAKQPLDNPTAGRRQTYSQRPQQSVYGQQPRPRQWYPPQPVPAAEQTQEDIEKDIRALRAALVIQSNQIFKLRPKPRTREKSASNNSLTPVSGRSTGPLSGARRTVETQLQEQSQAKINIGSATATNDQHSRGDMVGTSCLVTSVGLRIAEYFCECGWFYSLGQQFYLLFPSNWEHG